MTEKSKSDPASLKSGSIQEYEDLRPQDKNEDHQLEDLTKEDQALTKSLVRYNFTNTHVLTDANIICCSKLDKRLLPLLCILYLLSYIDRSNIGNAKLGGLEEDLGMTKSQYQWALSIFYFSYVLFDLPSNIIMRRWRPSYWLGILML